MTAIENVRPGLGDHQPHDAESGAVAGATRDPGDATRLLHGLARDALYGPGSLAP